MLIGVEDATRRVRGVSTPLELEERLANMISDSIDRLRTTSSSATCSTTRASRALGDLDNDDVLTAALERCVEVVGEAVSKVTAGTREGQRSIPWRQIVGMRNRLVHGHASEDQRVVWDVVTVDLPPLISQLDSLIASSRTS